MCYLLSEMCDFFNSQFASRRHMAMEQAWNKQWNSLSIITFVIVTLSSQRTPEFRRFLSFIYCNRLTIWGHKIYCILCHLFLVITSTLQQKTSQFLKMRRMEGWQLGRFCVCIVTASWPLPNNHYKKKHIL